MLLDETEDSVEVFCEHHEDILVKHNDGVFTGLQVKTRESDQPVWKTTDEPVRKSCARFARLEADFPGFFRKFRFLTNHPLHSGTSARSLRHILNVVRSTATVRSLPSPVLSFVRRIARIAGTSEEVVFTALVKTEALDNLPQIADIQMRLVTTVTDVWPRASERVFDSVARAASGLASYCGRASSLAHEHTLPAYFAATRNPDALADAARIAAKRIDRAIVLVELERALNEPPTLDGDPTQLVTPGGGATDLLRRKLDAGGFSIVSRNSAEDLRNKADYLGIVWTTKHGRERGLQKYGHVRSLVLSDAGTAFEATKHRGDPFGVEMLAQLRARFELRQSSSGTPDDCSSEHLEGFAYALTSECQIVWSLAAPWREA